MKELKVLFKKDFNIYDVISHKDFMFKEGQKYDIKVKENYLNNFDIFYNEMHFFNTFSKPTIEGKLNSFIEILPEEKEKSNMLSLSNKLTLKFNKDLKLQDSNGEVFEFNKNNIYKVEVKKNEKNNNYDVIYDGKTYENVFTSSDLFENKYYVEIIVDYKQKLRVKFLENFKDCYGHIKYDFKKDQEYIIEIEKNISGSNQGNYSIRCGDMYIENFFSYKEDGSCSYNHVFTILEDLTENAKKEVTMKNTYKPGFFIVKFINDVDTIDVNTNESFIFKAEQTYHIEVKSDRNKHGNYGVNYENKYFPNFFRSNNEGEVCFNSVKVIKELTSKEDILVNKLQKYKIKMKRSVDVIDQYNKGFKFVSDSTYVVEVKKSKSYPTYDVYYENKIFRNVFDSGKDGIFQPNSAEILENLTDKEVVKMDNQVKIPVKCQKLKIKMLTNVYCGGFVFKENETYIIEVERTKEGNGLNIYLNNNFYYNVFGCDKDGVFNSKAAMILEDLTNNKEEAMDNIADKRQKLKIKMKYNVVSFDQVKNERHDFKTEQVYDIEIIKNKRGNYAVHYQDKYFDNVFSANNDGSINTEYFEILQDLTDNPEKDPIVTTKSHVATEQLKAILEKIEVSLVEKAVEFIKNNAKEFIKQCVEGNLHEFIVVNLDKNLQGKYNTLTEEVNNIENSLQNISKILENS